MNFQICVLHNVSKEKFLKFWSSQYPNDKEHIYTANIGRKPTQEGILKLFEWKNNMRVSEKKVESIKRHFISQLNNLPLLRSPEDAQIYLNQIGSGAIWRIFWLHCLHSKEYPIYDQNVHRAMATMQDWEEKEIPTRDRDKLSCYFDCYIPFWKQFSNFDHRLIDKALWAYGRLLRLGYRFL